MKRMRKRKVFLMLQFPGMEHGGREDTVHLLELLLLSLVTGKVLDAEMMSKECRKCILITRKEGTKEFDEWWESHQHECVVNFYGSSGKKGSRRMLFNLQSHTQQVNEKIYGDVVVGKLECVGHGTCYSDIH